MLYNTDSAAILRDAIAIALILFGIGALLPRRRASSAAAAQHSRSRVVVNIIMTLALRTYLCKPFERCGFRTEKLPAQGRASVTCSPRAVLTVIRLLVLLSFGKSMNIAQGADRNSSVHIDVTRHNQNGGALIGQIYAAG
ncbi:unnamed protein product, partial [Iphiclides podalirius]